MCPLNVTAIVVAMMMYHTTVAKGFTCDNFMLPLISIEHFSGLCVFVALTFSYFGSLSQLSSTLFPLG